MANESRIYVTRTGKELTDVDIEALADEAELGYDVDEILARRGRRTAPVLGECASDERQ